MFAIQETCSIYLANNNLTLSQLIASWPSLFWCIELISYLITVSTLTVLLPSLTFYYLLFLLVIGCQAGVLCAKRASTLAYYIGESIED